MCLSLMQDQILKLIIKIQVARIMNKKMAVWKLTNHKIIIMKKTATSK